MEVLTCDSLAIYEFKFFFSGRVAKYREPLFGTIQGLIAEYAAGLGYPIYRFSADEEVVSIIVASSDGNLIPAVFAKRLRSYVARCMLRSNPVFDPCVYIRTHTKDSW